MYLYGIWDWGVLVVHHVYNKYTTPLHKEWTPQYVGPTAYEGVLCVITLWDLKTSVEIRDLGSPATHNSVLGPREKLLSIIKLSTNKEQRQ